AELADDACSEHERLNLIAIEHQRRQVIPGAKAIADTRFSVDRRSRQNQITDIAVDRPFRDLQLAGDVRRGSDRATPSEQLDDLEQTVGTPHPHYCAAA